MTNKEIFEEKMNDLADAINEKAGTTGAKDLDELAETVRNIPTGGGTLYMHNILMSGTGMNATCSFITKSSEPFTAMTFGQYLYGNGFVDTEKNIAASGKNSEEAVVGMHSPNGAIMWTAIKSSGQLVARGTGGLNFTDFVATL